MKKILSVMLVLVMAFSVSGLVGCVGNKKDTLTMIAGGQWVGDDYANLKKFIDEYNTEKPHGYKIDLTYESNLETALAGAVISGDVPDMVIWDRFNTPTYSNNDYLLEVEDSIAADKIDLSIYHPEAIKELQFNGHTYGLPLDLDTWGVFVNLDMIKEYNDNPANLSTKITVDADGKLSPDWTWEEMLEIAKKLTKRSGDTISVAGYSAGDMEQHLFKFAVSAGTDIVKDGKTNFNTEQTKDILRFYKQVLDANVYGGSLQEENSFPSKKIAMVNKSTYYGGYIKRMNPSLNFQFMPQPKYSKEGGKNASMIGGYGIVYPKPYEEDMTKSWKERHDVAWEFTKWWLTEKENALKWSKVSQTLPAITALYEDEFIKTNPTLANAASFVKDYKIRPQVSGYLQLQVNVINSEIKSYLNTVKSSTITNEKIEEAITKTIANLTSNGNLELK